jgi:hypothetical protein
MRVVAAETQSSKRHGVLYLFALSHLHLHLHPDTLLSNLALVFWQDIPGQEAAGICEYVIDLRVLQALPSVHGKGSPFSSTHLKLYG